MIEREIAKLLNETAPRLQAVLGYLYCDRVWRTGTLSARSWIKWSARAKIQVGGRLDEKEAGSIGLVGSSLRNYAESMDSIAGWLVGLKNLGSQLYPTPPRDSTSQQVPPAFASLRTNTTRWPAHYKFDWL